MVQWLLYIFFGKPVGHYWGVVGFCPSGLRRDGVIEIVVLVRVMQRLGSPKQVPLSRMSTGYHRCRQLSCALYFNRLNVRHRPSFTTGAVKTIR